jgi:hypothetical protein
MIRTGIASKLPAEFLGRAIVNADPHLIAGRSVSRSRPYFGVVAPFLIADALCQAQGAPTISHA